MSEILVTKPSMPNYNEYIEEIKSIWDTQWLTNNGPKHKQFSKELKDYLSVENIELFTNGHAALELSLQALELRGEVITTPFTFASTTQAIVRNGLTPVFCDIKPDDYTIDAEKIECLISEKTSAILPVHVYGNICDVEKIDRIAKKHKLKVVYDAAHTFGIRYKGVGIGNYGDVSCFSFHATKVFNSIEGGAVCYADPKLRGKFEALKNFGIRDLETVTEIGENAKMNEFCAAMGICNLKHIDMEIGKRKKVTKRFDENLRNTKGIQLNSIKDDVEYNYAYYPVLFDAEVFGTDRNTVIEKLKEQGINARKYFYPITSEFDCYRGIFDTTETPVAKRISESVLTLPLYADLDLGDVDRICEVIISCKK